ncbi:MAG: hypothetical protein PHU79_08300, partial [Oscillospiraceae bacterium]|nr:hypothetical protein [Oscillospiraceae bacterium]
DFLNGSLCCPNKIRSICCRIFCTSTLSFADLSALRLSSAAKDKAAAAAKTRGFGSFRNTMSVYLQRSHTSCTAKLPIGSSPMGLAPFYRYTS